MNNVRRETPLPRGNGSPSLELQLFNFAVWGYPDGGTIQFPLTVDLGDGVTPPATETITTGVGSRATIKTALESHSLLTSSTHEVFGADTRRAFDVRFAHPIRAQIGNVSTSLTQTHSQNLQPYVHVRSGLGCCLVLGIQGQKPCIERTTYLTFTLATPITFTSGGNTDQYNAGDYTLTYKTHSYLSGGLGADQLITVSKTYASSVIDVTFSTSRTVLGNATYRGNFTCNLKTPTTLPLTSSSANFSGPASITIQTHESTAPTPSWP